MTGVLIGRCDKGNMMGSERGMLEDWVSIGRRGVKIGEEIGNVKLGETEC